MPCCIPHRTKFCLTSWVGYGSPAFSANHFSMSATACASSGWFTRVPPVDFNLDAPSPPPPSASASPFRFAPATPVPSWRHFFVDEQWLGGRGCSRIAMEQLLELLDADADADAAAVVWQSEILTERGPEL